MLQACQIYSTNVESFIVDLCPEKLDVLINFILSSTKICIDKRIFDKKDVVIREIFKRCHDILTNLKNNQLEPVIFKEIKIKPVRYLITFFLKFIS